MTAALSQQQLQTLGREREADFQSYHTEILKTSSFQQEKITKHTTIGKCNPFSGKKEKLTETLKKPLKLDLVMLHIYTCSYIFQGSLFLWLGYCQGSLHFHLKNFL